MRARVNPGGTWLSTTSVAFGPSAGITSSSSRSRPARSLLPASSVGTSSAT